MSNLRIAITFVMLLIGGNSFATHIINQQLEYSCLGGGQYEVTIKIYTGCNFLYSSFGVKFSSATCGVFNYAIPVDNVKYVDPGCELPNSGSCSFQSFQISTFKDTVTLTPIQLSCTDWIIELSNCCTQPTVSNLQNASSQNMYLGFPLTPNGTCNSSPHYTVDPVIMHCVNSEFSYTPGAYDPDGDSLAYQLVALKNSFGVNILFTGGNSATSPFPTASGFQFDPATGTISGVPNAPGIYRFEIKVDEYKCGALNSYSFQTVHIYVLTCSTNNPSQSIIPGGGYNTITKGTALDTNSFFVNAGDTLEFTVLGTDATIGDTAFLAAGPQLLPNGATFSTSGTNPSTGSFLWVTQPSDSGYYMFTISVSDSSCDKSPNVYAFEVWVSMPAFGGSAPSLSTAVTPPTGSNWSSGSIDLTVTGSSPFTYLWSNGMTVEDPTGIPGGTYSVTVTSGNGCASSTTVTVPSCNANASIGNDTTICAAAYTISALFGNVSYNWCSGQTTSSINVTSSGTYCLSVTDALGCIDSDTMVLTLLPALTVNLGPDTTICPGSLVLYAGSGYANYSWNIGWTLDTLHVYSTGTYAVTVTDSNGCTATDSKVVTFTEPNFPPPNDTACSNGTTNITAPSFHSAYLWSNGATTQTAAFGPGNHNVILTDTLGCQHQVFFNVKSHTPTGSFTYMPSGQTINFFATNGQSWSWDFGDSAGTSSAQSPSYTYSASGWYHVCLDMLDSNGCEVQACDSVFVAPVGVEEPMAPAVSIYPNPTSGTWNLEFQGGRSGAHAIRISDQLGREIWNGEVIGSQEFDFGLRTSGVYFIEIAGEWGKLRRKLVKL